MLLVFLHRKVTAGDFLLHTHGGRHRFPPEYVKNLYTLPPDNLCDPAFRSRKTGRQKQTLLMPQAPSDRKYFLSACKQH